MKLKQMVPGMIMLMLLMVMGKNSFGQIEFTEVKTSEDWNKVTEKAKKLNKPIFLDVYATWCGPCKYLEKNVYTNPQLGEYYNAQFVNAKMDGETEFGSVFAQQHHLQAYPTMFFLTPDAQVITQIVGVREADPLKEIGKTVIDNSDKLSYYAANFSTGKLSMEELEKYQSILKTLGQDEKAAEVGASILPSLSEEQILKPENKDILLAASPDIDSKVFKTLKEHKAEFEANWSQEELNQLFGGIFNQTLREAIENKDEQLRDRIISELLPVYLSTPEDIASGTFITKKIYLANTDQWNKYGDLVLSTYKDKYKDDSKFLYTEAYELANNYSYSDDAMGYALSWINQSLDESRSFDNLVLAAYINAIKGNFDQANTCITEAEGMKGLNDDQTKMITELKRVIKQAQGNQEN